MTFCDLKHSYQEKPFTNAFFLDTNYNCKNICTENNTYRIW